MTRMSTLTEVRADLARIRRTLVEAPTVQFSASAQYRRDVEITRSLVDLINVVDRLALSIEVRLQANRALIDTHMSDAE